MKRSLSILLLISVLITLTSVSNSFAQGNTKASIELKTAVASIAKVNSTAVKTDCDEDKKEKPACTQKSITSCLKGEGGKTCLVQCKVPVSPKYCSMQTFNACAKGDGGNSCYKKYCKGSVNSGKFTPSNIASSSVNTALPHSGYGFECYDDADNHVFGTSRTIQRVKEASRRVFEKTGVKVFVGDISKRGGGYLPPHSTHQSGNDVDFANMGTTSSCESYDIGDGCYSRKNMKALLEELIQMGGVSRILFNDPVIARQLNAKYGYVIQSARGHHHHAHVEFK